MANQHLFFDDQTNNVLTNDEQRAQSDAMFASIGDGAITTDEFGRITKINATALAILGYSEDEVIGQWFPKIVVPVNRELEVISLIDRPITKAFLTGKSISERMTYRNKAGGLVPVSITVSPIILAERPIGAIEVFRDITLESEIDRMKSEFISLASHQLRTPLSAIKTYSHMLVEGYMGEVSDSQKQTLKTIINASNRMNELISTLLNITRIESGSIAVRIKPIDISQALEEVAQELNLMVSDHEVTLQIDVPKGRGIIRTDGLILKEIITNLVTNAIKYTSPGGNITLRLRDLDASMIISVKDTGMGIPKFAQNQIFTKFFRAQNVVKQETSGTGLGLYLVKGLVEALQGKIWFKSDENIGSTFYVRLPKRMAPTAIGLKEK
jgi:PAS domain S-box-containing protein